MINMLCEGNCVPTKLKEDYIKDKDKIVYIQDHLGMNCHLVYVDDIPTMAVIEMCEAYANYKE